MDFRDNIMSIKDKKEIIKELLEGFFKKDDKIFFIS